MQYILVENRETVLLGPTFWKYRFIQSELDDLEVDYTVSPHEPQTYQKVSNNLEIFPIVELTSPAVDNIYQTLSGPFWTYEDISEEGSEVKNFVAKGEYTSIDIDIATVRNTLKTFAASERYKKEVAGTKVTIQNVEVSVSTDRDSKKNFESALVAGSESVQWKFPETWLTLSLDDLKSVVAAVNVYVQNQFNWEKGIVDQIDAAQTVEELKAIVIVEEKPKTGLL